MMITVTVSLRSRIYCCALEWRRYKQTTASLRAIGSCVRPFDVGPKRPPDRSFCLVGTWKLLTFRWCFWCPWWSNKPLVNTGGSKQPRGGVWHYSNWSTVVALRERPVGPNMDGMMMVFASFRPTRRQPIILLHPRPATSKYYYGLNLLITSWSSTIHEHRFSF